MREIVFRGFHPDENGSQKIFVDGKCIKGKWYIGSFWHTRKTTYCFKGDYNPDNDEYYILFDQMTDWGLPNNHYKVDVIPSTVGQFTGLTDKNGTKIFEGDLCLCNRNIASSVDKQIFAICFDKHKICYYGESDISNINAEEFDMCEVIGNIHSNPELLKAGE